MIYFCFENSPFCYDDNSWATWSKDHFEKFPQKIITFQVRKLWNWLDFFWRICNSEFGSFPRVISPHAQVGFLPVIFFCCKNSPFCYNGNSQATWSKEHFENFPPKIITFQVRKLWNWQDFFGGFVIGFLNCLLLYLSDSQIWLNPLVADCHFWCHMRKLSEKKEKRHWFVLYFMLVTINGVVVSNRYKLTLENMLVKQD